MLFQNIQIVGRQKLVWQLIFRFLDYFHFLNVEDFPQEILVLVVDQEVVGDVAIYKQVQIRILVLYLVFV